MRPTGAELTFSTMTPGGSADEEARHVRLLGNTLATWDRQVLALSLIIVSLADP